jgi:uncharacterized peroxidase-related enzyme
MARISFVTDEDAQNDPLVGLYFEGAKTLGGRVANANRLYVHLPRITPWFLAFNMAIQREGAGGLLDGATKELIVVTTSLANQCDYCVAHNKSLGRATGLTENQLDAIGGDYQSSPHLDDRQKAIVGWCRSITANTASRDKAVFEELKRHLNEAEIMEVTWLSAYFCMINRIHDGLQLDLEATQKEVDKIQKSKYVSQRAILDYMKKAVEVFEASLDESEAAVVM